MTTILTAAFVAGADQLIKKKVESSDALPETKLKGRVKITRCHNAGFAVNRFEDHPKAVRNVTTAVGAGLLLLVLLFPGKKMTAKIGSGLLLGGAAGNILDRWRRGYVVDYVNLPKAGFLKKICFNLADVCLLAGIILSVLGEDAV